MTDEEWEQLPPLEAGCMRAVQTLVIGGGIVGLACALRLQAAGQQVLLIERERLAAGASRGNAGALAFSDVLPLASPGILRQAPRWLLDPLGPLSLRPTYAPAMLPWLWQFWRASQPARVAASTQAQAALLAQSAAEWPALLRLAGAQDQLHDGGNLHLYDSEAQWRAAQASWAQRAEYGIAFQNLEGADALAALQPGLNPALRHGVFVPHWQTVDDPLRLCHSLAQAFVARGGRLARAEAQTLLRESRGLMLQLADGSLLLAQRVLLCAGPWSHRLAASLGERFPLEAERGYNTTLPPGAFPLQRQLTFPGHGFVVTPIAGGVRVGGAVEFAGLEAAPNYARADAMLARARRFLPGLRTEGGTQWMGCRPSLPDSLPVIGPSPADDRLFYAFGHGHLGLTQAAATARLAADWVLAQGRPPAAFAPSRFL
ncbi:D-amino-acid dehydrogenase [Pelomonas saccharophila]|uniref:D-amino-acid dehydrogenase n=1 Tax=Roseateles saccharophilus TaxID=304 RepID=A0ABU1YLN5_ROSSA|nr:FAD-dependent oxidoreductase [Roseateles saccharophilus]MDR7269779.1 D-amino-acid dehydrogenase [Roseateles saccharophilus]